MTHRWNMITQSSYFCRGPDDFCWGPAPVGPTLMTGPRDVSVKQPRAFVTRVDGILDFLARYKSTKNILAFVANRQFRPSLRSSFNSPFSPFCLTLGVLK